MRKHWTIFETALLLGLALCLVSGASALQTREELAEKVVRLHVLANSDSPEDQALKLQVRDAVLARAAELLEQAEDRRAAEGLLRGSLLEFETLAEQTLRDAGSEYSVRAELEMAEFPTKEYDDFRLPAGEYPALRILIGEGAGQNWWCVVFPPLCTAASGSVEETALAAGLTARQVSLMTETEGSYQLKFKTVEWWESLRQKIQK